MIYSVYCIVNYNNVGISCTYSHWYNNKVKHVLRFIRAWTTHQLKKRSVKCLPGLVFESLLQSGIIILYRNVYISIYYYIMSKEHSLWRNFSSTLAFDRDSKLSKS